jgi:hypothetical protein
MLEPPKGFTGWQIAENGEQIPFSADDPKTTAHRLINMWSRWDAGWLLSVARDGYSIRPGAQSNTASFPLYPLAMRGLNWILRGETPGDMLFAGILVSNLALLVALAYLIALVRLDFDHATASRAAWYLLVFPSTLFFSAVYTEAFFCAFAFGAVYRARRGQWWRAGLLGGCAAATRFNGVFVLVPAAIEYFASCSWRWKNVRPNVLSLFLVPAGAAAYAGYTWWRFGNPLAYLSAAEAHQRHFAAPWKAFLPFVRGTYSPLGAENSLIDLVSALVFIALIAWSWRLVRPSYAAFATATFGVIISTGSVAGTMRHALPLFPVYLVLAHAGRSKLFDQCYMAVASGLAACFMALFAAWYWVA